MNLVEHLYEFLAVCGGSGGQSLGLLAAQARLFKHTARFKCRGSIDNDAVACDDYERFTKSRAWCLDIMAIAAFWTPAMFRAAFGQFAPHLVVLSAPCKGASRLLPQKKARTKAYRQLNRLAAVWLTAMLEAWSDDPPALIVMENVPGLPHRAKAMLRSIRSLLRAAGYVFHQGTHDCGEIGGLAQHRERFLFVARHPKKCDALLYQPPKKRVRAIGEVLSTLPVPATAEAKRWGELHTMPRLAWKNWLRLALIPPGGDWRDLAGVLQGRARREVFRRHAVADFGQPIEAVTGPGGHSIEAVADPRATGEWHRGAYGVRPWDASSGTVTGGSHPSKGRFAVADSRLDSLRVSTAYDAGYGVVGWNDPARTVAGKAHAGTGAYAVADPRSMPTDEVRLLTLDEAMALDLDQSKPPPFLPVIVAEDGTWHRPLTRLELAVLQSYPAEIYGEPIHFSGTKTEQATHIGNSIPPDSAAGIGTQLLTALLSHEVGSWSLSAAPVWVVPDDVPPSLEVRA